MEINGVANIKAIIDMAQMDKSINEDTYAKIRGQLTILEKYMRAVGESHRSGNETPKWHEVRDSK